MKRMAALLAVAGLMAATVPATAGAKTRCGGHYTIPGTHLSIPLC